MPSMQAFIFDMDGVIVDSELHWKKPEGYFLRSLVPNWTDADQTRIIGLSLNNVYRMLTTEYGVTHSKEEFLEVYMAMARQIYGELSSLMPGFLVLLRELHRRGTPVAVASSSTRPWIDIVLDRYDLRPGFLAVVSADDLAGGEGKPSPAIYLHTARQLGVEPAECVVMEDSHNGVLSAQRAGMYCIGFRNGFNDDQDISTADVIVNSYAEIDLDAVEQALRVRRSSPEQESLVPGP
ncbi:MAG TPA: HAD family hydrolase [Chloroflexia bacterium]|nr:HAD family hydrolase [Chloroflexia bacterium]